MPELKFVLPHWLYWLGLIAFPLAAMWIYRRNRNKQDDPRASLPLAYGLLLTGGFIGVHRLYLKSPLAILFILLFVTILFVNIEVRESRDGMSGANNQVSMAESKIRRAEKAIKKGRRNAQERMQKAQESLKAAKIAQVTAQEKDNFWKRVSTGLALSVLLLMIYDAFRLPVLVRKINQNSSRQALADVFECPATDHSGYDPKRETFAFSRWVSQLNGWVGEFVAWWSLIAVAVYYYEVMARYVFNSPTNWAHESMFLMFGMQYLLAGGYVLREGAHVRVDVLYSRFSPRNKAFVDVLTSVFFFIYVVALLVTGWIFFADSWRVGEVSFTEWAIQYWPVKISLWLGASLLLLQGLAHLLKDIDTVFFNPPDEAGRITGVSHGA